MYTRLLILLLLVTAFAGLNVAQGPKINSPVAVKLAAGGENFDPLGILEDDEETEKAPAAKIATIVTMASFERTAFDIINQKRAEMGLDQLVWCEKLAAVARNHSVNMAEFKYFSHRGLDSKLVSDRADREGLGRWRAIGENIAYNRGYKDPVEKAIDGWLTSPAHRRNMLDDSWKEAAVGVALAEDGSYYFTQVFLKRK